jgi:hypothetical protein
MRNDKLEPGDLAIIIKSMNNSSVGKIVTCITMDGVHSKYGRMWLVESGSPLRLITGDVVRRAHVPEDWLKKIPRDPLPDEEDDMKLNHEVELPLVEH